MQNLLKLYISLREYKIFPHTAFVFETAQRFIYLKKTVKRKPTTTTKKITISRNEAENT